ncbi:hypothetical protein BT96DRAFT_968398, partial [Gymnopus androsaceus JB14]
MDHSPMGDAYGHAIAKLLNAYQVFPGDGLESTPVSESFELRFKADRSCRENIYVVRDLGSGIAFRLPVEHLKRPKFDLYRWTCKQYIKFYCYCYPCTLWLDDESVFGNLFSDLPEGELLCELELNGVQVPRDQYAGLQRNAASVKDPGRKIPRPVVVEVKIDGHPAKALIDSGSLGDFISNTLEELKTPLTLQLAVQGSRSKINWGVHVDFAYQNIKERRYFDAMNLSNYDLILGTPWLFQHQSRVVIGCSESLPLQGPTISQLASRSMEIKEERLDQ